MPIEIRELVIKATLGQEDQAQQQASSTSGNQSGNQEAIVKLCVDQVLRILKEKAER